MRLNHGGKISGEGVGKSTQLSRLAAVLREQGRDVAVTREPGGTPGAEAIRALLLDPATTLDPLADTLLVFAVRADHVRRMIRPALTRCAVVLCDRFTDSTMAYQGHGLGVDRAAIKVLARIIGLKPDLTIILDAPPEVARERLAARGSSPDRYERFDAGFAAKVAEGFRSIATAEPERCVLIDASGPADAIAAVIANLVRQKLFE
ncbi:dTMP kinase [Acidiphilium sp. AL]|uniref:Thymidylate kinase n=1 Tax=Acidiphilium iwatense TaxID=768198 RepID=A0ABS9E113_9PROT|nr:MULTISPECIES: dTMP kinase [Acidiphilium]MCF3948624.1 dTMP kinase [Acidiphilium iwatense]MCU4161383.1 dTMP kinase [Acidiphilium sp. AL]